MARGAVPAGVRGISPAEMGVRPFVLPDTRQQAVQSPAPTLIQPTSMEIGSSQRGLAEQLELLKRLRLAGASRFRHSDLVTGRPAGETLASATNVNTSLIRGNPR